MSSFRVKYINKLSVYKLEKKILAGLKQNSNITGVGSGKVPETWAKSCSRFADLVNSVALKIQDTIKTRELKEI